MEFNNRGYRRRPSFVGYFLSALFGALIGGFLLLSFAPDSIFHSNTKPNEQIKNETQKNNEKVSAEGSISGAANRVMPSVVGITTVKVESGFFSKKNVEGVGSGIIVDESGLILTNNHVAGMNAKNITVSLYNGDTAVGKTIWSDSILDLSIVKIDPPSNYKLPAAVLGDSKGIIVGENAIAIGNPLGLKFQRSVTAGIISALNRTIQVSNEVFMEDLIQTDASINPGNSGGPLINIRGEVIGINTVKVTSAEGIGFAIPVNIIKPVLKGIRDNGEFKTPYLGIVGFDREISQYYGRDVKSGIYIYRVENGSPALKAGIKEGDVIISVNDREVNTMLELKEALYNAGVNGTAKLKIKSPLGTEEDVETSLEAAR